LSSDTVEYDLVDNEFWGSIPTTFDALLRDAAEILTRLAWGPWKGKVDRGRELKKLRNRAIRLHKPSTKRHLRTHARAFRGIVSRDPLDLLLSESGL
jgi:hypothetical protein